MECQRVKSMPSGGSWHLDNHYHLKSSLAVNGRLELLVAAVEPNQ